MRVEYAICNGDGAVRRTSSWRRGRRVRSTRSPPCGGACRASSPRPGLGTPWRYVGRVGFEGERRGVRRGFWYRGERRGREGEAMGSLCCCLSSDHFEGYVPHQNGALSRECPCVRCCLRWFLHPQHYSASFDEVDHEEDAFPIQISTSGGAGGGGSLETSTNLEVFQAPPTPLPYDSDPRYLRIARDGLISRRDKSGMSHLGEAHPLRHSNSDGTALQRRFAGIDLEEQSQGLKLMEKNMLSSKAFPRVESDLSMLDDDDVCPTCLDGYNEENPRITTACGHSFHLSCIYEWMERSKRCPLCDKEMIFNESL